MTGLCYCPEHNVKSTNPKKTLIYHPRFLRVHFGIPLTATKHDFFPRVTHS